MKLLVIASREMAERKLVWAAAGYAGLAGLLFPWLAGFTGAGRGDASVVVAVALVFGFVLALSAVLGATMVPADLAARRLGFYLARPVGMGTLLGGRLLGAWLLVVGGAALVALIQAVAQPRHFAQWAGVLGVAALIAWPVLLLFHCLGLAWRARSLWLLLDLASLGGFTWAVAALGGRILAIGAWDALPWFAGGVATLVPVVLAVAVYLQMARGRADLRRGHRIQAWVLAAGLLALALAGTAYAAWVCGSGPGTLSAYRLAALAPQGDWALVTRQGGHLETRLRSWTLPAY